MFLSSPGAWAKGEAGDTVCQRGAGMLTTLSQLTFCGAAGGLPALLSAMGHPGLHFQCHQLPPVELNFLSIYAGFLL